MAVFMQRVSHGPGQVPQLSTQVDNAFLHVLAAKGSGYNLVILGTPWVSLTVGLHSTEWCETSMTPATRAHCATDFHRLVCPSGIRLDGTHDGTHTVATTGSAGAHNRDNVRGLDLGDLALTIRNSA